MLCEEYPCNCGELQDAIDSYNAAVDRLRAIEDTLGDTQSFLRNILVGINTDLKKVDATLPDGTKGDCDDCGGEGGLKNIIKETLANIPKNLKDTMDPKRNTRNSDMGNFYANCCGGGENDPTDPFDRKGTGQFDDPCGKAGDSVENAPLFSCDPIPEMDDDDRIGADNTILIQKLVCKPTEPAKCNDGLGGAALDLEVEGGALLVLPRLSQRKLGSILERIDALDNYLTEVGNLTNYEQNVGGAAGSLRNEACLTRLLDLMCKGQIKGAGDSSTNDLLIPGTTQAQKTGGKAHPCYNSGCRASSYHCCHQLMNALASRTLTYGHTRTDATGTSWNESPPCPANEQIEVEDIAYVVDGNEEAAVIARLNQLAKTFPGCADKDGNWRGIGSDRPVFQIDKNSRKDCNARNCPCNSAITDMTDESRRKLLELKRRQRQVELEIEQVNRDLAKFNRMKEAAEEALEEANRKGMPQKQIEVAEAVLEDLNVKILAVKAALKVLEEELPELQIEIDKVVENITPEAGAYCISFKYIYCPANSTPREGTGSETNTNTSSPSRNQRNFFDLLGKLNDNIGGAAARIGCANPLNSHLKDCFGEQKAKDPLNPDSPVGGRVGPQRPRPPGSENRGNRLGKNDPCSENDTVNELPSWWYPDCNGFTDDDPPVDKSVQPRAECLQKVFRIMKNWIKSSAAAKSKLSKLKTGFVNLSQSMNTLESLAGDIEPPPTLPCKGFSAENVVEAIDDIVKAMGDAAKALEDLKKISEPE